MIDIIDVVIIGGGPGGYVAAIKSRSFRAKGSPDRKG